MSRYEPTRDEHEERLAASHARDMAEQEPLHEWRLRMIREISEGMKSILEHDIRESKPF